VDPSRWDEGLDEQTTQSGVERANGAGINRTRPEVETESVAIGGRQTSESLLKDGRADVGRIVIGFAVNQSVTKDSHEVTMPTKGRSLTRNMCHRWRC
jgi:hypothetical protein